jgi:hypothetical protein
MYAAEIERYFDLETKPPDPSSSVYGPTQVCHQRNVPNTNAVVDAGLGTETEPLRAPPIEPPVGGASSVNCSRDLVPPLVQGQQLCFERLETRCRSRRRLRDRRFNSRTTLDVVLGGRGGRRVSDAAGSATFGGRRASNRTGRTTDACMA